MTMLTSLRRGFSRRDVIKTAATVSLMASVGQVVQPRPAYAAHTGKPGTKDSGKAMSRAPAPLASAVSAQALS